MYQQEVTQNYLQALFKTAEAFLPIAVESLVGELIIADSRSAKVFLCGNGGSSANAAHVENDFSIGISRFSNLKLKIETLGTNLAVSTAIANDFCYEEIFSKQLYLKGSKGDLLIVFSGSGNSPNIIKVLQIAKQMDIRTCGVFGFDGGVAKSLVDVPIHFPIDDMQISEDLQLILGHLVLRQFEGRKKDS